MAVRGRPLDVRTILNLKRLVEVTSIRRTAREADVDRNTVRKYTRPGSTLPNGSGPKQG